MYKKEKQGIIHLLMIVAALLVVAILLEWYSAIMWMSVAFVVVLVWLIFDFHQRLAKLEQRAVDNQTQTLPIPSKVPQDAISQEERLSTEPFTPDWMFKIQLQNRFNLESTKLKQKNRHGTNLQ